MISLDGEDLGKSVGISFFVACARRLMVLLEKNLIDLHREFFLDKHPIGQLDSTVIKLCTITGIVRKLAACSRPRAGEPEIVRPRLLDESTTNPEYRSKS